jgi:glucose-6-phosphate 1-dehydrogenase
MLKATYDFVLILFGASGHLARLRLFPALYFMALKGRFPEHYAIVGFARTAMDDWGFRNFLAEAVRAQVPSVHEEVLRTLLQHVHYLQGQYDDLEDFRALSEKLRDLERNSAEQRVRLAYLSIPPTVFRAVMENLCRGGIYEQGGSSTFRCIVEKPVGRDYQSADEIRQHLTRCFQKQEMYLLDHYLGKEAARNIYYLRLVNPIVERVLKHTLVRQVQITAVESAGLEGRAGYFEAVGTLRDMFQSHMLELMALLTMQLTERERLPQARLEALHNIYVPPAVDLSEIILQGQYSAGGGHRGYCEEEGVARHSRTPTYAAIKLMTRMSRWQGTPFFLRSGKCLHAKETYIAFEFQNPYVLSYDVQPNRLMIILQGEAGMQVHLQTKMGGSEPQFRPLVLEDPLVCVGDCMDEHGLLLLEAVNGKQDWFLDFEEVAAAWKIIDPLQAYLDRLETPLSLYPCGSAGPVEAEAWLAREGFRWM